MKIDLKQLIEYKNIAVVTHTRPDGDAIGSSIGLYFGFSQLGKEIDLLCDCVVPKKMRFLWGTEKFKLQADKKYDLVIFVDCSGEDRIGNIKLDLRKAKVVCIDHHVQTSKFGDISYVDTKMASACELVLEVLLQNGIIINKNIANVLYTGIMTDTGSFAHTNVTSETFKHAAVLTACGAETNILNRKIFKILEGKKYKLMGQTLNELKLFTDERIAIIYISRKMLNDLDLDKNATEGLVDNALSIEGVQIAAAIMEDKPKTYKVSLRSVAGIEVNKVAENFGGGGHKQASGCTLCGYFEDVIDKFVRIASLYVK